MGNDQFAKVEDGMFGRRTLSSLLLGENNLDNKIKLPKEKRQDMITAIKAYFWKERGEDLGDLAAGLFLDFITDKLAIEYYNQGVYDAYRFINQKTEDLLEIIKY